MNLHESTSQNRAPADKQPIAKLRHERDSLLAPLPIDELIEPTGSWASDLETRYRDQGILAMPLPLKNDIERLDWTARQVAPGIRGHCTARRFLLRRRARELFADCG